MEFDSDVGDTVAATLPVSMESDVDAMFPLEGLPAPNFEVPAHAGAMQADSDGCFMVPSTTRSECVEWRPPGPSQENLYDFAPQFLELMVGSRQGGHALSNLSARAVDGRWVDTMYSGMAFAEMATNLSLDAVFEILGKDEAEANYWSASDISPHCRKILKFRHARTSRRRKHTPQHVFGDVMERIPSANQSTLQDMYKNFEYEFNATAREEVDPTKYGEDIGRRFMDTAISYLEENFDNCFNIDTLGKCYKCDKMCHYYCVCKPPLMAMWLVIAGSTCTSWSRMGRKRKWAAASALPFLVWAFSMAAVRPDVIIHECTVDFDHHIFERIFGMGFIISTFVFTPKDLGFPASRPRRYTLIINRERCAPSLTFDRLGFGGMFFRTCVTEGHAF